MARNSSTSLSSVSHNISITSYSHRFPGRHPRSKVAVIAAVLCNAVDDLINNYLEKVPLRPWMDPRFNLADNFGLVEEITPVECAKIEGTLPACLDGVYIRNTPNPRYVPRNSHHLFDGDRMLHYWKY